MSDLVERLGSDARRGVVATYNIAGNTLATIGVLLVLVLMVLALAGPLLVPHDPLEQDLLNTLLPPAWLGGERGFLLGTDSLGRDILSRLIYGARVALTVAVVADSMAVDVAAAVFA